MKITWEKANSNTHLWIVYCAEINHSAASLTCLQLRGGVKSGSLGGRDHRIKDPPTPSSSGGCGRPTTFFQWILFVCFEKITNSILNLFLIITVKLICVRQLEDPSSKTPRQGRATTDLWSLPPKTTTFIDYYGRLGIFFSLSYHYSTVPCIITRWPVGIFQRMEKQNNNKMHRSTKTKWIKNYKKYVRQFL